jgi:hypothetical protein
MYKILSRINDITRIKIEVTAMNRNMNKILPGSYGIARIKIEVTNNMQRILLEQIANESSI